MIWIPPTWIFEQRRERERLRRAVVRREKAAKLAALEEHAGTSEDGGKQASGVDLGEHVILISEVENQEKQSEVTLVNGKKFVLDSAPDTLAHNLNISRR